MEVLAIRSTLRTFDASLLDLGTLSMPLIDRFFFLNFILKY